MAIVIEPWENLWIRPFQETFTRGFMLGLQEALEEKEREKRLARVRELAEKLREVLNVSPENTIVLNAPSFELEEPELKPFLPLEEGGIRKKIEQALSIGREQEESPPPLDVDEKIRSALSLRAVLGIPEPEIEQEKPSPALFVSVPKTPKELESVLFSQALPFVAEGASLGVNFLPLVDRIVQARKAELLSEIEEAQKEKAQQEQEKALEKRINIAKRFIKQLAKRRGIQIDEETIDLLAHGLAEGFLKTNDLRQAFKKNVRVMALSFPDGSKRVIAVDKDREEAELIYSAPFDFFEFRKQLMELEEEREKRKEEKRPKPQKLAQVKVEIPMTPQELRIDEETYSILLRVGQVPTKTVILLRSPDGHFFTPIKKLPVNPNDPEDVREKLFLDSSPEDARLPEENPFKKILEEFKKGGQK